MNVDGSLYCAKKENIKKKKRSWKTIYLTTKYRKNGGVVETNWLYIASALKTSIKTIARQRFGTFLKWALLSLALDKNNFYPGLFKGINNLVKLNKENIGKTIVSQSELMDIIHWIYVICSLGRKIY